MKKKKLLLPNDLSRLDEHFYGRSKDGEATKKFNEMFEKTENNSDAFYLKNHETEFFKALKLGKYQNN